MLHPIQRIYAHPASDRIYTATSNVLHVFSASTGALLSTWTAPVTNTQHPNPPPSATPAPESASPSAPSSPAPPSSKRQKLDPEAETESAKTARTSKWNPTIGGSNNAITKLSTTSDGSHLIVATSEDKAIRVFSTAGGKLELLSTRSLPKRVADFSPLGADTILAGDKHGDVFALPLHPDPNYQAPAASKEPAIPHALIPNDIREATAAEKRKRTEIDYALPFEHNFALGHVSMLLSVLPITVEKREGWKGDRTWIVTSDRDEHIRVTRWPDTFVIERFLLRHESFVSSLCCPQVGGAGHGREWLLSGGGDEYVLAWKWESGEVKQRLGLREVVEGVEGALETAQADLRGQREGEKKEGDSEAKVHEKFKIVVNGIWEVPGLGVVVGMEKLPLLAHYVLEGEEWALKDTLRLNGNVLDVTTAGDKKILVTTDPRKEGDKLVTEYEWNGEKWVEAESEVAKNVQEAVMGVTVTEEMVPVVRRNVLYTVGSLRKEFRDGDIRNAAAKAAKAEREAKEREEQGQEGDEMEE